MNILVVDDDTDFRCSLTKFIGQLGHQVLDCDNGQNALKILKKRNIHLVLSDIKMPFIDGHELLKRIKKKPELEEVVVILFTGYGDIRSAVDAMRIGAYDYILKPIDVKELAIVIKRISEYVALRHENKQLTENFELEVQKATKDIKKELTDLRKAYAREVGTTEIGIFSNTLGSIFQMAKKLHNNRCIPVLIGGETGTGKDVIARYIHYGEGDVTTPFVGINCAAIPTNLMESELFGYEAGAFSGGNPKGQKGKLELANEGTLFLDEITELSTDYQAKLLRVIEEREYFRVGGIKIISADVRFIFATNQDIKQKVSEGTFRRDLYYRMNISPIVIPPLRERREEIIPLVKMFLQEMRNQKKTWFVKISKAAARILEDYEWPGNVRELKNTLERIAFLWDNTEIKPEHLDFLFYESSVYNIQNKAEPVYPNSDFSLPKNGFDLKKSNLDIVRKVLEMKQWNKTETARYLGISRRVLYSYLKHITPDNN